MPPPPPPAPVQKKGLPTMAWVGIGCGGIVILGIIAAVCVTMWGIGKVKDMAKNPSKASAELMVRANKDLEKVSENDATGEMTIRVKSTGEQMTLNYDDLAKGRFTFKDKDGKVVQFGGGDLSKVPSWVPRYPGVTDETLPMVAEESTQNTGMLSFTTRDPLEDVKTFYKAEADKLSLNSSSDSSFDLNGERNLAIHFSGGKREITVNAFGKTGEPLNVQVFYVEKK
ncbi:hypothetical protein KBB96_19900 [Luteolibacter ambystomatis]|uniref:Uncharacterized protein n=2 Tax=Luteolibacter ambystomatis TaxID=2824561 RepID=A0A975IZ52_9BACT|nr:hypothetical protein [Luteolibacter ambystomatis]QUE51106.1 hypothetical protein KBB96_19900 [Luteolibacter ambystomatis]